MNQKKRICYFIPFDSYVEGYGYRVSAVREGEPGHHPTGNWPYDGSPGKTMPWFWGHDYDEACRIAIVQNAKMGISKDDATEIIASSMAIEQKNKR